MTPPLTPWERAEAALAVLAVDPAGVKGLWLRGRASALRDRVTAGLPIARRVHPGVDDVALFGGVDLAATLAAGQLHQSRGLLADHAPVILTMAERCPPGLSARLARWLDEVGPCLVALDEGAEAEETLPSALADRLGLFVDLGDLVWSETAPLTLDPARLEAARALLPKVRLPETAFESLTTAALAFQIASQRAPLLAAATARALAAWRGEVLASDDTLRHAAELTLAHRGTPPQTAPDQDQPPPPPSDADQPQEDAPKGEGDRLPEEILLEALRTALPPHLLAQLAAGRAARSAKGDGSGAKRKGNHRGRPLPSRPGVPGAGARIDLVATLRAAAPWQTLRRRAPVASPGQDAPKPGSPEQSGPARNLQALDQPERVGPNPDRPRLEIRKADLRIKRYQETSDRVLIFTVDASGSSAFARMAEAKGAVELMLEQAYARRDHVALVAFRGQGAELLLPPTRSLVQTKRRLAGLPGGGGTPLAAGLRLAFDLALRTRARGMTPTVALLTDGRGNVGLDGAPGREAAEADSLRMARALRAAGLPGLVIDTATRPQAALRRLAEVLDAPYLPLPRADSRQLSAVMQAALEQ
ncbi:magnesium chelatase subunit D [bacterium]|nr:magnesium chelatase subunit D [bacterium]